jgi:hypothetical protein
MLLIEWGLDARAPLASLNVHECRSIFCREEVPVPGYLR